VNDQLSLFQKEMEADAIDTADTLTIIRNHCNNYRDMEAEIKDLRERLDSLESQQNQLTTRVLPDLLRSIGIHELYLPPSNNLSGIVVSLDTVYRAAIPDDWSVERKKAAFDTLDELNMLGLVKSVVSCSFNKGEAEDARKLLNILKKYDYEPAIDEKVHWRSLSSSLKQYIQAGNTITPEQLAAIGGYVSPVVKVKERIE
jgi:hypothetical protein